MGLRKTYFLGLPIMRITEVRAVELLMDMQKASNVVIDSYFIGSSEEDANMALVGLVFTSKENRMAFITNETAKNLYLEEASKAVHELHLASSAGAAVATNTVQ